MKTRTGKRTKDVTLLVSVAESIGSTLGTIAAKANAAQKALTRSRVARTLKREGKNLTRKSKRAARRTTNAATKNLKDSKIVKASRRGLRRVTSSAKRATRRGAAKIRSARRANGRR
jgi:hypothetical protein